MVTIKAIAILVIIFGVLVGIHELGHFLMAKLFGVWVQEFAFGFGPTIFSKKYKDTLYKINLIPLGGYVKLYGEQTLSIEEDIKLTKKEIDECSEIVEKNKLYLVPEEELESMIDKLVPESLVEKRNTLIILSINHLKRKNDQRRYSNKSIYSRLIIVLGGVVMNFLLGAITFVTLLLMVGGKVVIPNIADFKFWMATQNNLTVPIIRSVENEQNKALENSLIIEANGQLIKKPDEFVKILNEDWDSPIQIKYYKDGHIEDGAFSFKGQYDTYYSPGLVDRIMLWEILENSPAELSGISKYDTVIQINGIEIKNEEDFLTQLKANKGKETSFKIYREEVGLIEKSVMLNNTSDDKDPILGANYGLVDSGVDIYLLDYSNGFTGGFAHSVNLVSYQLVGLRTMISQSLEQKDISIIGDNVGGPIRIGSEVINLVKANNLYELLSLFGLISLTLAFMNVLPLPIVDGGHVVLLIIEKIRRRPLSDRSQKIYNLIGLVFIIGLSLIITIKDILQFF